MNSEPIRLAVRSEVGRLRTVMVHRPGREIDRMVPGMMEEFLFDDILHGERARAEHDVFRQVLHLVADEVLDVEQMLADSLRDEDDCANFLGRLALLEELESGAMERLLTMSPDELAAAAIGGLETPPDVLRQDPSPFISYPLHPLPNMLFMRDPLVVVDGGAILGSMARKARRREPFIMKFTYAHNPRIRMERPYFDEVALMRLRTKIRVPGLEGGDILVLDEHTLAIGASERTSEVAVELLAQELQESTPIQKIFMVLLPRKRAVMHLDTVFTMVSRNQCLVYPPMFLPGGAELAPVVKKDLRGSQIRTQLKPSLLEALREEGIDLEPICCGGREDRIDQQREQWSDGANALALAPGVITLYRRNVRTAEELGRHGFEVVTAEELIAGGRRPATDGSQPIAILIPGTELSRARGGPRCMSMPLVRDPLP